MAIEKDRVLSRLYKLYRDGRDEGVTQGYMDYFKVAHFVLTEVEKLQKNHYCCKYQTIKKEDFCDECLKFVEKQL